MTLTKIETLASAINTYGTSAQGVVFAVEAILDDYSSNLETNQLNKAIPLFDKQPRLQSAFLKIVQTVCKLKIVNVDGNKKATKPTTVNTEWKVEVRSNIEAFEGSLSSLLDFAKPKAKPATKKAITGVKTLTTFLEGLIKKVGEQGGDDETALLIEHLRNLDLAGEVARIKEQEALDLQAIRDEELKAKWLEEYLATQAS